MNVHKCNAHGKRLLTYPGEVIAADDASVIVRAVWTRERQHLPYVTLEPGDVFIETFYRDRWYNVFEVRATDGTLKGWVRQHHTPAAHRRCRTGLARPGYGRLDESRRACDCAGRG